MCGLDKHTQTCKYRHLKINPRQNYRKSFLYEQKMLSVLAYRGVGFRVHGTHSTVTRSPTWRVEEKS